MNQAQIVSELQRLRDPAYAAFQAKITPNTDPLSIIGVRTPALRALAKAISRNAETGQFLSALPHTYLEENQLHAFVIAQEKDFDTCLSRVEAFLPYVDNWMVCDQLSPAAFQKQPERLLPSIERWLCSDRVYTVRFGIGMLMAHFLDERFKMDYAERVACIRSDEYYINMMIAWYFATALAKQYDAVLPLLQEKRLDDWTHNKAIQKCVESRRITAEQKAYLKTLKVGKTKD